MEEIGSLQKVFKNVLLLNRSLKSEIEKKNIDSNKITPYQMLLLCALDQAEHFSKAINILIDSGFSNEASPIVRSFFELFITVKLVSQNKDLAERYGAFAWVLRKKMLKIVKKYGLQQTKTNKEPDISEQEIEEKCKEATREYNFKSENWWFIPCFANLRNACVATGDEKNYDITYKYLSDFAHVNIMSLSKFSLEENGNQMVFSSEKGSGYTELGTAVTFLLTISNFYNAEFNLGFEESVNALVDELTGSESKMESGPTMTDGG